MSDPRDELKVWLDAATPTDEDRSADAAAAWSRRRRPWLAGVGAVATVAAVLGVWWVATPKAPKRVEPEYSARLFVTPGGDAGESIRIEIGVRTEVE